MFRSHRHAFLAQMEEGDLALFPGASHVVRNDDVEFPFRQESDFFYLTGFCEADAILMLAQGIEGLSEETLFVLPKDPERETWTGRRIGPEGAVETLGFAAAASVEEAAETLSQAIHKARRFWYRLGDHEELDAVVLEALRSSRKKSRLGFHPPDALVEPTRVLHEMRLFKSEAELELMRRSAAVSAEAHLLAMAQAAPGVGEWEIEALLNYTFRRNGGDSWAYPPIVAGGANACILHYNTNHMPLEADTLLLVDAGAEFSGYAADITRTFPVSGRFSGPQREVYEAVLAAQQAALEQARPGLPYTDSHDAAVRSLCESLRELKVLHETVDEIVEKRLYRPWYMHNTSHWLGLDVHDAGRYTAAGEARALEEGMVLTIEPGLYFSPDDEHVPPALRGIGVRIEDDVLITGGGHEVLTVAAPKSAADVEAACAAERVMPPTLDSELVSS